MTWEALDEFCGRSFWDYQLTWNTTNPDVTPCLERTLLTWIPCTLLWVLLPLELYLQKTSFAKPIPWTGTNITRMLVAVSLTVLCIANMMDTTFNRRTEVMFNALIVSDAIRTATFVLAVILMAVNKKRGIHTSGVLFVFWFCLTACEMLSYRSALLQLREQVRIPDESAFIFQMIYFPLLVTEMLLSCVADVRKKPSTTMPGTAYPEERECPELSSSFLSKMIFWWFNEMAILGWKKPLTTADLWQLSPENRAEYVASKFDRHWRHENSWELPTTYKFVNDVTENGGKVKELGDDVTYGPKERLVKQRKQVHIVWSLVKTFWSYFIVGSACKFVYDVLQFVSPMVLKFLIDHVQSDQQLWKGILFSFLLFGTGCLQSVLLGHYFHRMFVLGMRMRTALVSAIYQKSLVLSSASRRKSTVGEIVNLMSVDSQRFMDLMTYLNMLWSAPLQIIIAVVMLWKILGPSVLAGLFVMVILLPANAYFASKAKRLQMEQMKSKDERVKLVNEVLSGIKVLKLYAWEEAFKRKILGIRNKEAEELWKIANLNAFAILIWNCSPFLVALASFATYVVSDERNILDATTAFVSLSLFNILRFPLTMLPNLITTLVMVSVSVKRINSFMNSEELVEYVVKDHSSNQPVMVHNGYFSWSRDDEDSERPILRDINLTIEKGTLVAIVGQVGCGKSSLLSAILGDMEKIQGCVSVNGSIAYVCQQPWIQNATLQDNIVFAQPFNNETYKEILDACGLMPDLAVLPGGDQTEIGEKGINLSGGQKQRVSLARAVYSSADIYLMDDPLSAVDSHVGRQIFDRVIGPNGLIKNKTRILVTHGLTYLSQTDVVVVMKNGAIAEMGSFQQLVDRKGPFAEFLSQYLQEVETTEDDLEVLEDIGHKNPELLRSLSERSSGSDCISGNEERRQSLLSINRSPRSSSVKSETKEHEQADKKLIQTETAETGEVQWSVYVRYLKAVGLRWVAVIFLSSVLMQLFSVGSNVWLSDWGKDYAQENYTHNITQRNNRLSIYGGLGIGQAFAVIVQCFSIAYGTLFAASLLHEGLLQNVLRSPMSFFDTTPIGRIVNRFSKDVDTLDVTIPITIRSWLMCLLQVVATIVIISIQTPIFMSVIVPVGLLYYFIQRFYVSTSRQLKRLESITRSPIYSHFSETLTGCSTIRAYAVQDRFCKHSNGFVDNNQICYYPSICSNRWLAIRLDFCGNCIILFSSLFAVLSKEELAPGEVGLSVSYALMVTATLNWLIRMTSELETNIVAVERILEYSETPTEAAWVIDDANIPEDWPNKGHIRFDDYCTRYREGLDLVLRGVNCEILPCEKIGIVGRTGAGKSSLTLSLFRIIEAASGGIIIDGVRLSTIGLHQLRSKITIIPQEPVLFSGSLRMNLDPFSRHSDHEIWVALDHAHLSGFVSSLEKGLSHEVVEGGENLSVGQRQLVCLGRALLRKTKVLVLDEATAAVDLETDDLIQDTIRKEFSDSTVLTIAHRLNTVIDYDRIMVLDNGQVAEFDTPTVLLKNRRSIFYGMAKDAGLV